MCSISADMIIVWGIEEDNLREHMRIPLDFT